MTYFLKKKIKNHSRTQAPRNQSIPAAPRQGSKQHNNISSYITFGELGNSCERNFLYQMKAYENSEKYTALSRIKVHESGFTSTCAKLGVEKLMITGLTV